MWIKLIYLFCLLVVLGHLLVDGRVQLGNEVLRELNFSYLLDCRTTVFSNPSGCFPDSMIHIIDELNQENWRQKGVKIVNILAPEHGFRGDRQAEHGDPDQYIDKPTGKSLVYSNPNNPCYI